MGQWDEAETALKQALEVESESMDYLHAMADHYLRRGLLVAAGRIAQRMVERHPDHPLGHRILRIINEEVKRRGGQ